MALPKILEGRLSLPVVCSPMFIVSNPDLVIAQCKAGVVGSFPSLNARPAAMFEQWLQRIGAELEAHSQAHPEQPTAPFAVNLIVHRSNDRLLHDLELCVKYKVPIVITSLGARSDVNEAIHSYGGIVLHDIINDRFARKAIEKGADGLIAVAAGAGGHAGTTSPFALVQEIREWFDGPLLLSGCIANGRSVLAAQAMGADLAYIGSAFIATDEANAIGDYKQMVVDSHAADIVYTSQFSGVNGNYLKPSIARAGMDPDNLADGDASAMDFGTAEVSDGTVGPKAWKDIWGCGQGIGAIKAIESVGQRVERLLCEYQAARRALCG
ncbi:nitronate monooxygenase family protein [Algiphilus sp. W345]|uniref:Nitronate monooxygenase family protein n=1 Tax=Banduia mediterranea TaxID=3075609 RepID=A0ABU2WLB6_9GAMM|nr:nitronate monooxygenase family protein [Algiphilus sp. W345]MDT0498419.1 nitronate monooxygenase family protein [Algiphilus sp. W345]